MQNKLKVGKLDEKDVFRYILVFLRLWGVRGKIENYEVAKELADVINNVIPKLEKLRDKSLLTIDFDDYEEDIKTIYTKINDVKKIGATATSKTLHLLNPNLFVMWDQNIRSEWNKCLGKKNFKEFEENIGYITETATGYVRFMRLMQKVGNEFLKRYMKERGIQDRNKAEEMLSKEYCGKSIAKLLDEYCWLIATGRIKNIKDAC